MERLNNNTNMESQNSEASMDLIVSRAMAAVKEDQKQDIVHEKPTLKHSVIKTAGAMATAAAIGLGMTGCAEIQETPTTITEVQPSETKPSVTTSESGTSVEVDPVVVTETTKAPTETTIETTATPTETTVETIAPTETDVNAELAAAPEISGLSKEIEDGKVVYKAVEGNEYGIEAGEFAGEYNPNVSVEGEQVGAIAFIPAVAEKILNDQLAKTPEGEQEFKVLLPVDTTQAGENKINITSINKDTDQEMLQISCDSDLDVSNIIPDSDMFYIYWSYFMSGNYASILYTGANFEKGNERDLMYCLTVIVPESSSLDKKTTNLNIKFASNIGSTDKKDVYIGSGGTEGPHPVKISDIMTIDGKLVGIISEK